MNIGYVIFDECHFFLSDSLFADNTYELLKKIISSFTDSVRIYMTATRWGTLEMIRDVEYDIFNRRRMEMNVFYPLLSEEKDTSLKQMRYFARNGKLTVYSFPRKEKEILLKPLPHTVRDRDFNPIINAVMGAPQKEKWIIFVESKEKGQSLQKTLQTKLNCKNAVSYIDTSSKNGDAWQGLIQNEKFDSRILVATSVADCGINVLDSTVKHLVIFSTEHTRFIQELGRKRLRDGEKITVYVPNLSLQQLTILERLNNQLVNLANEFERSEKDWNALRNLRQKIWRTGSIQERHLLDIHWKTGNLQINECAKVYINRRRVFFEDLRNDYENGVKSPFLVKVAEWLNVPVPDFEDVPSEEEKRERAKEFLQSYLGIRLDGQMKKKFVDEAGKLFTELFGPRKGANTSRDKREGIKYPSMSGWIEDLNLGFALDGKNKDDTPWHLVKVEE